MVEGINEIENLTVPLDDFSPIYKNTFINSVHLQSRYTPKAEVGEMLVIAPATYSTQIQPFVNWKNQKGIKLQQPYQNPIIFIWNSMKHIEALN